MNRTAKFVATGAATISLLVLTDGTATAAPSGDGCNRYEICFSMHSPDHRYQKHFFYSGSHEGHVWWDVILKRSTHIPVQNNASALANRDGSCDVKVVNDRGVLPDITVTVPNNPDTPTWYFLGRLNDANDRHERVNCA